MCVRVYVNASCVRMRQCKDLCRLGGGTVCVCVCVSMMCLLISKSNVIMSSLDVSAVA